MKAIRLLKYPALFIVLIFILLHTAIQLGRDVAVQWLLDQGAESARIHSLSVNWLSARIRLYGVQVQTPDQPDLRLDELLLKLDYGALFKQRILVQELAIKGLRGDLRQNPETGQFAIGPVVLPAAGSDEEPETNNQSPWLFGLERMTIDDLHWQARLKEGDHKLQITDGELSTFYMWQEQAITALKLNGSVNGAVFDLDSTGKPLPDTKTSDLTLQITGLPVHSLSAPFLPGLRASLSTDLKLSVTMGERISLRQQGIVSVENFSWQDNGQSLALSSFNWRGNSEVTLHQGGAEQVTLQGKTSATNINFTQPQLELSIGGQQWQGRGELNFTESGLDNIVLTNNLGIDNLTVLQGDRLALSLAAVDWQGPLTLSELGQQPRLKSDKSMLELRDLDVRGGDNNTSLLNIVGGQAADVMIRWPEQITVASLGLSGVELAEAGEDTLARLNLELSQLIYQPDHLTIASTQLDDVHLQERLSHEKEPQNLQRLQHVITAISGSASAASGVAEREDIVAQDEQSGPFQVTLPLITVTGDSRIGFSDQSTEPVFNSEIVIKKARIRGLDTQLQKPASFELGMQLNGFTTLELTGNTDIVAGGQNADWQGQLKQLDLPRLSPYSIATTGYYLQNGQLHLDAEGSLKQGQIEGSNHIQINRLEVEVADQEQMGKFSKKLSMPLGTAIGILQDSNDNIDLDIPVSGSLEDPDFGIQSVINRLAGKGLKQAAFSFLTRSLQPYGALISLAAAAAKDGAFVHLQPVAFSPGSAALDETANDYLSKIDAMMLDRKGMRLNICGQAVQQDQQVIRQRLAEANKKREKPLAAEALAEQEKEQLAELAQQRSDTIKQVLTETISGERLFNCFPVPALDDPQTQPSATLGL